MNQKTSLLNFKDIVNAIILLILITSILFIPTSSDGVIKDEVNLRLYLIVGVGILFSFLNGNITRKGLIYFLAIQFILVIFTVFSLMRDSSIFTWNIGSYLLITALTFLFTFDLSKFKFNRNVITVFLFFLNSMALIWAFGIIFNVEIIKQYTLDNFSQYSGWTLPVMLEQNKPVYSLGTHSYSAFFTFLLIVINLVNLELKKGSSHMLNISLILLYLIVLILTKSTTSVVFFVISIILLGWSLWKSKNIKTFLFLCIFGIFSMLIMYFLGLFNNILDFSRYNGFQERYIENLYGTTFNFIKEYVAIGILRPLDQDIILIDSGLINFLLKGSIFFLLIFYRLFYLYLKNNLRGWGITIFISFLLFESGVTFFSMDERAIAMVLFVLIFIKAKFKHQPSNVKS